MAKEDDEGKRLGQASDLMYRTAVITGVALGLNPQEMAGVLIITATEILMRRGVSSQEIAVLVRTLTAPISATLEDELTRLDAVRAAAAKHGIKS